MHNTRSAAERPIKVNWLELARAAGGPDGDLGIGIRKLATLAAATHRNTLANQADPKVGYGEGSTAHGWALQAGSAFTADAGATEGSR
jgi:hypothetical protein